VRASYQHHQIRLQTPGGNNFRAQPQPQATALYFLVLAGACQFGHGLGGFATNFIHSCAAWPNANAIMRRVRSILRADFPLLVMNKQQTTPATSSLAAAHGGAVQGVVQGMSGHTLHLRLPDGRPIFFWVLVLVGACQSGTVRAGLSPPMLRSERSEASAAHRGPAIR